MTENNEKDDYEILVDNCIASYRELLNTSMALDINMVQGKMRSIILKDERFVKETKAIKAKQYLDEIRQVNDIYSAATKMGGAIDTGDEGSDGRDGGGMSDKQIIQARKEALSMQLKAAEMRRNLKSLTAESSEGKEEDAINFFFTALTEEEMRKIRQVEVNDGSEDESDAFKAMKKEEDNDPAAKTLRRKEQTKAVHGEVEEEPEPTVLSDGTEVYED